MLHFCQENGISFTDKFSAPCLGHQIDALSGPTCEDDFVCARCTDVFCNTPPRFFVSLCCTRTQGVQPTMNVGIIMLVKVTKRLDHRARFLGSGRAIKIDQRMAMGLLAQNREIFAKGLPIDRAGGNLVHTIICSAQRCAPILLEEVKRVKSYKVKRYKDQ